MHGRAAASQPRNGIQYMLRRTRRGLARTGGTTPAILRRLVAIGSLLLAADLALAQTLEVYRARSRSAEELLPLAEQILGEDGRVVVDRATNALILAGPPERVEEARRALDALDRPRASVQIRWESIDESALEAQRLELRWRVRVGSVRVGNLFRRGSDTRVQLDVANLERREGGRTRGQLRVLDGEVGRISTGTSTPVVTRRVERGPFGRVLRETVEQVPFETGFEARPRVLSPERIELALRPFRARIREDGSVDISEADTLIVVEPGETVVVGQIDERRRSTERGGLLGGEVRDTTERELLLVTAELVGAPAPAVPLPAPSASPPRQGSTSPPPAAR